MFIFSYYFLFTLINKGLTRCFKRCFCFSTLGEPTALQLEKQGFGYVVASLGELGSEVPYTTYMNKKVI